MSHPRTTPVTANPAKSMAPNLNCSLTSSFVNRASTSDTKPAKSSINPTWLSSITTSFSSKGDIVGIEDDESIQKAGNDEESVPILIGHRHDSSLAKTYHPRDDVRCANSQVS